MTRSKNHSTGMCIRAAICLLAMLLSACGAQPTVSESQPATSVLQTSISETQQETVASQSGKNRGKPFIRNGLEWDAYSLSLMEQWVDTDTFISAEMLQSRFGNFKTFYFGANLVRNPPFSGYTVKEIYSDFYTYSFSKADGGKYDLHIEIEKLQQDGVVRYLQETTNTISSADIDPDDLRTSGRVGTYWVGDIGYTYVLSRSYHSNSRVLSHIQWKSDEYVLRIKFLDSAIDFTLEDGDFIAQLLREQTAGEAMKQFEKDISLCTE